MSSYKELTDRIPSGRTDQRPDSAPKEGGQFYDTQRGIMNYWDGAKWIYEDGTTACGWGTDVSTAPAVKENGWRFGLHPGDTDTYGTYSYLGIYKRSASWNITCSIYLEDCENDMLFALVGHNAELGDQLIKSSGTIPSGTGLYSLAKAYDEELYEVMAMRVSPAGEPPGEGKNIWRVMYTIEQPDDRRSRSYEEANSATPSNLNVAIDDGLHFNSDEIWYRYNTTSGEDCEIWLRGLSEYGSAVRCRAYYGYPAQNLIADVTAGWEEYANKTGTDLYDWTGEDIYLRLTVDHDNAFEVPCGFRVQLSMTGGPQ
jgi:hypothetical protein